jgi:PAS domain S-box-containing protein
MLGGQVGLVALRDASGLYTIRAMMGVESERFPEINQQLQILVDEAGSGLDDEYLNPSLNRIALMLDRRLRQSLFLPLVIAGEPVGLLIIFRASWVNATDNDLQVLQSFADQAAIAVNNAQLYARIDHERKRLAAILENSADGVMILGADLRVQGFNRALERMTGWTATDAAGRNQDEVITWKRVEKGDLGQAIKEGWPFRLATDAPLETLYVEGDLFRRDGMTLGIAITYAPLLTTDGQLSNIIANVRDITNFRRAQEMQNVFISTVSHELKTPVALIKGYAGTLRREDADWDKATINQGLEVIEDESDRLAELIENLLSASKLQAQRMQLDLSDVHIDRMATQVVERFKTQTQIHQFKLNFPPDFPVVSADEVRLRQVLDNLISNAIKYSPNGGTITVGGEVDLKHVTIFVRDQGAGINERDQERLFERFFRVDGALSRSTQGTGLGLYLAKAVIDAHGGSIHVTSKPGVGSTFYFTLPL